MYIYIYIYIYIMLLFSSEPYLPASEIIIWSSLPQSPGENNCLPSSTDICLPLRAVFCSLV